MTDVFEDGKSCVELVDTGGDELSIINAAKVSFATQASEIDDSGKGLIRFLLKNKHGSPFEHNYMNWYVKAPIFVFREWHRHRIGISINEWSARYSELKNEFYIPTNFRTQVGKPGHYTYEPITNDIKLDMYQMVMQQGQIDCWERYKYLLDEGVAKEIARQVLPVNIYSEMRWTCNARSLMNFLALRNSPNAQWEIKQYAQAMEDTFAEFMPTVHQAFIDNGRIAP